METTTIAAKIESIEIQLKIIKAYEEVKKIKTREKNLVSLKGILKGKGKFDECEIESAKIKYKDRL